MAIYGVDGRREAQFRGELAVPRGPLRDGIGPEEGAGIKRRVTADSQVKNLLAEIGQIGPPLQVTGELVAGGVAERAAGFGRIISDTLQAIAVARTGGNVSQETRADGLSGRIQALAVVETLFDRRLLAEAEARFRAAAARAVRVPETAFGDVIGAIAAQDLLAVLVEAGQALRRVAVRLQVTHDLPEDVDRFRSGAVGVGQDDYVGEERVQAVVLRYRRDVSRPALAQGRVAGDLDFGRRTDEILGSVPGTDAGMVLVGGQAHADRVVGIGLAGRIGVGEEIFLNDVLARPDDHQVGGRIGQGRQGGLDVAGRLAVAAIIEAHAGIRIIEREPGVHDALAARAAPGVVRAENADLAAAEPAPETGLGRRIPGQIHPTGARAILEVRPRVVAEQDRDGRARRQGSRIDGRVVQVLGRGQAADHGHLALIGAGVLENLRGRSVLEDRRRQIRG